MEARYRAARAFVLDVCADIEASLDAGADTLTTEQLLLLHLCVINSNRGVLGHRERRRDLGRHRAAVAEHRAALLP